MWCHDGGITPVSGLQLTGCGFYFQPRITLQYPRASFSHLCTSVTKQWLQGVDALKLEK